LKPECLFITADTTKDPPGRSYESTLGADRLDGHESGAGMPALPKAGRLSSQAERKVSRLQVLQAQIQRERMMSLFEAKEHYVYH